MLAHKVDGKNPSGYSNLFLVAWKLDRRAEAREPLPPKTAVTSWSNVTHSWTPGYIFPSSKLKGNATFTTQAVTIGNDEGGADSGAKEGGEGEMEPSADGEVKASGRVRGTDQTMEYTVHFTTAVKLYQKKNRSCFGYGSPNHLMQDCPKDISKSSWKADLNTKEGMAKKGGWAPQNPAATQQTSLDKTPKA